MVRLQLFLFLLYCFVFCIRVEYHCLSANAEAAAALFYCFLNKFISGLRRAHGLSTNPYPVHRLDKVRYGTETIKGTVLLLPPYSRESS